jgi:MFS family permease
VNLALQAALGGYFLIVSLTLQLGLGLDVLTASLTTLPFSVGVGGAIAVVGRKLGVRYGRRMVRLGLIVMMCAWLALIAAMGLQGLWLHLTLVPVLLASGIGMGLVVGPLSGLALGRVDIGHAGAASGVFHAVQQLGGALGAAGLGVIYFAIETAHPGASGFRAGFGPSLFAAIGLAAVSLLVADRLPAAISAKVDEI